ncbi:MAG: universal stress protein [Planctomycetes bacterium]|nr:universal stress protein [Planctomycetota bacterium]MBI3847425.1 universal stress protein [Planctomycetota bacterium]
MFSKILVPLDGSDLAESILPQMERIYRVRDAEIVLLRAVPLPALSTPQIEALVRQVEVEAFDYVTGVAKRLEAKGITAKAVVKRGNPEDVIPAFAAKEGVDLITMSTHGRTGISRWTRGSVAEGVLRLGTTPLLLMHSFEKAGSEASARRLPNEIRFARVLVPVDDSSESQAILPHVEAIAKLYESQVTIFHAIYVHPSLAMYPSDMLPVPSPTNTGLAEKLASELRQRGIRAAAKSVWGEPAWEIIEELRNHSYDVVAMSTHGRRGVERLLLGSVAEKLLRTISLPILLVRA